MRMKIKMRMTLNMSLMMVMWILILMIYLSKRASPSGMKMAEEKETGPKAQTSKMKNQIHSTTFFSPTYSPTSPSPKPDMQFKKENPAVLRLLSRRIPDSSVSTSLASSPPVRNDHSFNSADSDG